MSDYSLAKPAQHRLDEIYQYTVDHHALDQADAYIDALFACFEAIASRAIVWRAIPAEFAVNGYFQRCQSHFVYWRELDDGSVGIVTILHERMHQIGGLGESWGAQL